MEENDIKNCHLSEAEREVMEVLWENTPIKQSILLEKCNERGKDWKRQTLNTLLIRLEEKGIVKREKRIVSAVISGKQYGTQQITEILNRFFDGKLSNFMCAFSNEELSEDEAEKLLEDIERYKRGE